MNLKQIIEKTIARRPAPPSSEREVATITVWISCSDNADVVVRLKVTNVGSFEAWSRVGNGQFSPHPGFSPEDVVSDAWDYV